jgi:glutathione S-transferase
MSSKYTLVSHVLCPYVQRATIVLVEKGATFERREVDLADKPHWFRAISPLGKTPVLLVGDTPIFESAVICEYLEDTLEPRLHPRDALQRARHRAWVEMASALLNRIAAFYNAPDELALEAAAAAIRTHFEQLEAALGAGPYFDDERFSVVDAAFGPVFRYFDVFDAIGDFGLHGATPKLDAWRATLARRPSVRNAVRGDYPELLRSFLLGRRSALSRRMQRETQPGAISTSLMSSA